MDKEEGLLVLSCSRIYSTMSLLGVQLRKPLHIYFSLKYLLENLQKFCEQEEETRCSFHSYKFLRSF